MSNGELRSGLNLCPSCGVTSCDSVAGEAPIPASSMLEVLTCSRADLVYCALSISQPVADSGKVIPQCTRTLQFTTLIGEFAGIFNVCCHQTGCRFRITALDRVQNGFVERKSVFQIDHPGSHC